MRKQKIWVLYLPDYFRAMLDDMLAARGLAVEVLLLSSIPSHNEENQHAVAVVAGSQRAAYSRVWGGDSAIVISDDAEIRTVAVAGPQATYAFAAPRSDADWQELLTAVVELLDTEDVEE